jgi:hypothetical protein
MRPILTSPTSLGPGNARLDLLCFAVLASVLIGCSTVRAQDVADTQLEIEMRRGPGLPVERYALTCNPPGGTVLDPLGACHRIADLIAKEVQPSEGEPFTAGSTSQGTVACTQIYGGPEVALIRGRFLGAPVDARLTREDGCTMSSFDATMRLLGIP